eukprot:2392373-Prymnesium_polylepis.1
MASRQGGAMITVCRALCTDHLRCENIWCITSPWTLYAPRMRNIISSKTWPGTTALSPSRQI